MRENGYSGDFSEFALGFGDIFMPIEPMIALQRELRERLSDLYLFEYEPVGG
jgi:hypothetical protein